MVDKELIEIWRNELKPAISLLLLNINYEEVGEQDKEEFERDFDEFLDLALIGLKYKTQLSHEGTTKGTPYLKEYATADPDTAIGGLREMGDNLLREIHSRAMSRMGDCISRQAAIDALDEIESEVADGCGYQYEKWRKYFCGLPSAQPEEAIPVSWIEARIKRFITMDNAFGGLTANIMLVMLNEWKREQEGEAT